MKITEREKQILELLATGLTYEQIGTRLGITGGTARNHTKILRRLFNASNVMSLVRSAQKAGMLS